MGMGAGFQKRGGAKADMEAIFLEQGSQGAVIDNIAGPQRGHIIAREGRTADGQRAAPGLGKGRHALQKAH